MSCFGVYCNVFLKERHPKSALEGIYIFCDNKKDKKRENGLLKIHFENTQGTLKIP